jgi:hypothetical protein
VKPFLIGFCNHTNTHFKGKISDVKIYNEFFENVDNVFNNNEATLSLSIDNPGILFNNVSLTEEDIEVIENIIPFRRQGSFYCLPHVDEGFINGRWAKGETTARNEKRFVTQMQQGKIDYKNDGMNNIMEVLDIDNIDKTTYNRTSIINCKMK